MKILIINSAKKFIGEAAHSLDLADHLCRAGHDAGLVVLQGSALHGRARDRNVPVWAGLKFESVSDPKSTVSDFMALRRLVLLKRPDVLHCHRGSDHGLAVAVVKTLPRAKRPALVRTRHRVVPVKNTVANRWLFGRATDWVIAVSRKTAESFGPMRTLIDDKLTLVYSSVDTDHFHPERRCDIWRQERGIAPDEPLVGLIARLQRVKGQEPFLRAAAIVAEEYPKAKFLVAGIGPPHKRVRLTALAEELGLKEKMIFEDWLSDVQTATASLDVGVLASLGSEGSSRVTYEYMASGVAVVATTVGCLPEVVEHEETGYLVPPGDVEAMAEAIKQCLVCDEGRTAMNKRALERVREHHTRERWVADVLQAYKLAIARRKA